LAVGVLVALYLSAAVGFALVTPYGEAPDEFGHLQYIEHLVRYGTLPGIVKNPYSHEAVQPPLYYIAGAVVVLTGRGILNEVPRTAPLTPPIQSNPAWPPPGHSNMVLLHPTAQRWLLWPLVLRGCSILLGVGVILLTYLTARVLVPSPAPATVPLIATAFAALIPQANFIRASVSNENLADLVGAWILLLLSMYIARPYRRSRLLWLGVVYGLGILTKLTLAPLAGLILPVLWARRPRGEGRCFARDLFAAAALVGALISPYLLYHWLAYGDPLALAASNVMLGRAKLEFAQVISETFRWQVWSSFWGVYGWQTVWMPPAIYFVFAVVTGLGLLGGVVLLVRHQLSPVQRAGCFLMIADLLLMYVIVQVISLREIVWQGRELYPALAGTCILFGFGLTGLLGLPTSVLGNALWGRRLGAALLPTVTVGLFALNFYSIVWLVLPALNPR